MSDINLYIEGIKKGLEIASVGHNSTFALLADHLMDLHMTLIAGLADVSDIDLSLFNDKGEQLFADYLDIVQDADAEPQHLVKSIANVCLWLCAAYSRLQPEDQDAIRAEFYKMALDKDFFNSYIHGGKDDE